MYDYIPLVGSFFLAMVRYDTLINVVKKELMIMEK